MVRASLRVLVLAAVAGALMFAAPTVHVQADTDGNGADANNGTLPDASAVWMRWLNGTSGNGSDAAIQAEMAELRDSINSILAQLAEIREQLNGTMPMQPAAEPPPPLKRIFIPPLANNTDCAQTKSCFLPSTLTVDVGDRVQWTRDGFKGEEHAIIGNATGGDYYGKVLWYGSVSHTFSEPGIYPYFCGVHQHMQGTIIVK